MKRFSIENVVLDKIRARIAELKAEYDSREIDFDTEVAAVRGDGSAVQRVRSFRRGSKEWESLAKNSLVPWPEDDWYRNLTGDWNPISGTGETYRDQVWDFTDSLLHEYFGTFHTNAQGDEIYSGKEQDDIQSLINFTVDKLLQQSV